MNCSSYLTLNVSCCSIRGATDQTGPHRVLGIHFSVAMILLDLFVFYLELYIQIFDVHSLKKSQLALKGFYPVYTRF